MRKILPRVFASSATATLIALLAPAAGTFGGHHDRVETVYVEPMPTTMIVPSSYTEVVPSSYSYSYPYPAPVSYVTTSATLLPASYSYAATSYSYTPVTTAYYVPAYYRSGLFGRRLRPAAYESTAYYLPTTVATVDPSPVMATAYRGPCKESSIAFTPPTPAVAPTGKSITSKVAGVDAGSNNPADKKDPAVEAAKAQDAAREKEKEKDKPAGGFVDPNDTQPSPPPAPAPEKKEDPAPEPDLPGAVPKAADRSALRPAATDMKPRLGVSAQNVLRGEVVSGVSGKIQPGIKVVFSDLSGHYKERTRETDARGGFEVFLPNGDWSVTVVDSSAAAGVQPKVLGNVTSTGGKYLDEGDRPIYSLRLWN